MRKFLLKITDRIILWGARHNEVGVLDGIYLADLRKRGDSFCDTIQSALCLIRDHDPRRYARIKRFTHWIINQATSGSARYEFSLRACYIEFYDEVPGLSPEGLAGLYACILVHESTHGLIESRGIGYSGDSRPRIERACVQEQNRFAASLVALDATRYPKQYLLQEFSPSEWQADWARSRLQQGFSVLSRGWQDMARTRRYRQRRDGASSQHAAPGSRRA